MPIDPTTTNLSGKDYSGRDLRGLTLSRYRVMRVNFSGADLRGVSFREADCTGADFTGAQLDGCDFTDAIIEGAIASPGVVLRTSQPVLVDSGSPVVWQLEDSNKALESRIAELSQQLGDALEEIKRLKQPPALEVKVDSTLPEGTIQAVNPDGSTATLNNIAPEPPAKRGRKREAQE